MDQARSAPLTAPRSAELVTYAEFKVARSRRALAHARPEPLRQDPYPWAYVFGGPSR